MQSYWCVETLKMCMDHALWEGHLERCIYREGYLKFSPLLKRGTFISCKHLHEHSICKLSTTVTPGKSWMQRIQYHKRKKGKCQIFQTGVYRGTKTVLFPSVHPHFFSMEEALTRNSALSFTKKEGMFWDSQEHELTEFKTGWFWCT